MKVKCIFLFVSLLLSTIVAQLPPENVRKLATQALNGSLFFFEEAYFKEAKLRHGFNVSTKVSDLVLGHPVKYFDIGPDEIAKSNKIGTILSLGSIEYSWLFPVLENGQSKIFITISKRNNSWTIRELIGGHELALELDRIKQDWPETKGFHPIIVDVYPVGHYFHVPEVDNENLTPIIYPKLNSKGFPLKKISSSEYKVLNNELSDIKTFFKESKRNKNAAY